MSQWHSATYGRAVSEGYVTPSPTRLRRSFVDTPTYSSSTPGLSGGARSPSLGFSTGRRTRKPSMSKEPYSAMIPPQRFEFHGRLVVVLDLDETLVFAREGPVLPRPGCGELLERLAELGCEVLVWTAGEREYAQEVLQRIDTPGVVQHCIYRHEKWWSGSAGYRKDIANLGRPMDLILFVDNTPDCLRGHEDNAILVSDFTSRTVNDSTLYSLQRLCHYLCTCRYPVPQALAHSDLVTKRTVRSDVGGQMTLYCLATDSAVGGVCCETRINRDLPVLRQLQYKTSPPKTRPENLNFFSDDSPRGPVNVALSRGRDPLPRGTYRDPVEYLTTRRHFEETMSPPTIYPGAYETAIAYAPSLEVPGFKRQLDEVPRASSYDSRTTEDYGSSLYGYDSMSPFAYRDTATQRSHCITPQRVHYSRGY